MTQVKGIELVVEGIRFSQEPPTFEQEMYIMQQIMDAGLDQPHITLGIDPKTDDLERPVKQLIVEAYRKGILFKLLGSMVTEEGTEWSVEQAERNADLFRKTRDPKAIDQLQPALAGAIVAFFMSAVSSEKTSPMSSGEVRSLAANVEVRPRSVLNEKLADQVFSSGIMPPSSEKSPSTKKSRPKKSSAGKSAKD